MERICEYVSQLGDGSPSKTFSNAIVLTTKQAKIARGIVGRAFLLSCPQAAFVHPQWFQALVPTDKRLSLPTLPLLRPLHTNSFTGYNGDTALLCRSLAHKPAARHGLIDI